MTILATADAATTVLFVGMPLVYLAGCYLSVLLREQVQRRAAERSARAAHLRRGAPGPADFYDACPHCRHRTPQIEVTLDRAGTRGQLCLSCGEISADPRRIPLRGAL